MLLPPDDIQGLSRGHTDQFLAYLHKKGAMGPYREWVETVEYLCSKTKIDKALIWFQGDQETGSFKNAEWFRGNTTGLVIATDPLDSDGEAAALLHVATMWMTLGRTVFPKCLQPVRYKLAPNWVGHLLHSISHDETRPPVRRVEDLALKYQYRPGSFRYTWSADPNYANQLAARALSSGVQIPNQSYLHRLRPYAEPKIIRATHRLAIFEGPHYGNRVIGNLSPGQQFSAMGETTGHAARGIAKWYVMNGPLFGYVHSYGVVETS